MAHKPRHTAATRQFIQTTDKLAPKIERAFINAIDEAKDGVVLVQLQLAISNNDVQLATSLVDKLNLDDYQSEIEDIIKEAATLAKGQLPKRVAPNIRFNLLNPKTVEAIQDYSFSLVTQVQEEMRKSIQAQVLAGYEQGLHPTVSARRIRDSGLGLTTNQVGQVTKFREQLVDMTSAQRDRATARYSRKLLNTRSKTIARTESNRAMNIGQQSLWEQNEGILSEAGGKKYWLTANDSRVDDVCTQSAAMNSNGVPIGQPFNTPNGPQMVPNNHPNERCNVVIRFEED